MRRRRLHEAGGSGYSAAFTHPDPLDPNDVVRQKTQSRDAGFPYDSPVSYGRPTGTDTGGASYQRTPDSSPPRPRGSKASDEIPYGEFGVAWEQLESMLGTYSPGDQADDALSLGYGSHGRLGEDEIESGPSDLLGFFGVCDCDDAGPTLLGLLSPDVPDGEREDTYDDDWDAKVYAPGGEDDPA